MIVHLVDGTYELFLRLRSGYPDLRSNSHVSERFYVALARCDAGIRGLGGADESAAATRALRKGCGPMTMRCECAEIQLQDANVAGDQTLRVAVGVASKYFDISSRLTREL